jgi:hypothetical protein
MLWIVQLWLAGVNCAGSFSCDGWFGAIGGRKGLLCLIFDEKDDDFGGTRVDDQSQTAVLALNNWMTDRRGFLPDL